MLDPALLHRLLVDALEVDAGAVVVATSAISFDSWRNVIAILPVSGLLAASRCPRALDAVRERVAQQVLERRGDLLQHAAIDLGLRAFDLSSAFFSTSRAVWRRIR